jgi:hypothetical protein
MAVGGAGQKMIDITEERRCLPVVAFLKQIVGIRAEKDEEKEKRIRGSSDNLSLGDAGSLVRVFKKEGSLSWRLTERQKLC